MVTRTPKITETIDAETISGDIAIAATAPAEGVRAQLNLKELVDRVIDRTGAKKNEVKSITEAVLQEMGLALAGGEDLNMPGFGKVKVKKDMDNEKARIFTVKVRQVKSIGSSI